VAGGSRSPGQTVLSRAIAILDSFSHDCPEQTLGSIVRATALPPATAHRLLAELVGWGGLERSGRGTYRVGLRLWQLGALAPGSRRLRDAALPYLEDLYEATHQVVHLAVLDGLEVLYVEKLSARPEDVSVSVVSEVGRRLPSHATGPGKVLLAYSSPKVVDRVVAAGLPRLTPYTITDPARLSGVLAEIRRTGVCLSRDEMTMGASSVAAPISGPDRAVIAAVSVVLPSRVGNLTTLVPAVRAACFGIGRAYRQSSRHLV
jgi:DNA-binding IclR family transcriptional regulator